MTKVILTAFFLEILYNETNWNDFASAFQINNDSKIVLHNSQNSNQHHNVHKQHFPTQDEELVKWATQKFGGVTSFTTIRNPINISLSGTNGENYLCNLADNIIFYTKDVRQHRIPYDGCNTVKDFLPA